MKKISTILLLGAILCVGGYSEITYAQVATSSLTVTSNSGFSDGTLTSTTVTGSGDDGSVGLSATVPPVGDIYKRAVAIDNTSNSHDLLNNIVSFDFDTASLIQADSPKMQADCGDIRFRDSDDATDITNFNIAGCDTSTTTISVQVPFIGGGTTRNIYMYYGTTTPQESISSTLATSSLETPDLADHLSGSAVYLGQGVIRFNEAGVNGAVGILGYDSDDAPLGTDFDVRFQFAAMGGCCDDHGADATYFYAYAHSLPTNGEDSAVGGYSINYDEYNYQGQIQIEYDGEIIAFAFQSGIGHSGYHQARVHKTGTHFDVYYDGTKVIDFDDIARDESGEFYGFAARNGGETNTHTTKGLYDTSSPAPSLSIGSERDAPATVVASVGTWTSPTYNISDLGKWGYSTDASSTAITLSYSNASTSHPISIYARSDSYSGNIPDDPYILIATLTSGSTYYLSQGEVEALGLIAKQFVQIKAEFTQTDNDTPTFDAVTFDYTVAVEPGAPTDVSRVSGDYANFVLGWTPPVDDGGYIFSNIIYYRENVEGSNFSSFYTGSTSTTYQFAPGAFIPGHTYEFFVRVENVAGYSPDYDIASTTSSFIYTFSDAASYNVSSCDDLQHMADDLFGHYTLTRDLNCAETATWNSDGDGGYYGFAPIGDSTYRFGGSFDGQGHTITGLYIHRTNADYVGLFGVINEGASVYDLGLENVNITGSYYVGALAGGLSGTVTNVHSTGAVTGEGYVGGLVGTHIPAEGIGSSSPLVFTWNGSAYDFIGDVGRGIPRNTVGNDTVAIAGSKLQPKNNKYTMQIQEEYNEIVYYDELALKTFDHAPGFGIATSLERNKDDQFYTVSDTPTNPLVSCTDMYSNDCLTALKDDDDKWSYKDQSNINYWTMNFGSLADASRILLVLRATENYSLNSTTTVRSVQVKNAQGNWVSVLSKSALSAPAGAPRDQVIDLTGKFPTHNYDVRIGFDKTRINYVAIDTAPQQSYTMHTYHPSNVDLHFFGYTDTDKTYFWDHDYSKVSATPSEIFAPQSGNFTKYGDVTPLLQSTNDQYVVMHHGDQMTVDFEYTAPAEGMVRDFALYNWATFKHADMGLLGKTVEPLPYVGMPAYPYSAPNAYPMTDDNANYLRTWNTRIITETAVQHSSTIIDSYSTVSVTGYNVVGGLVGYNEKMITGSYATGNVRGLNSWNYSLGGLVGGQEDTGIIIDSYATGNVSGMGNDDYYMGGLAGYNYGTIINSYATGSVYGTDYLGGLLGYDYTCGDCGVNNSFSTGDVTGGDGQTEIGGFIGAAGDFNYVGGNGASTTGNNYWYNTTQTVAIPDNRDVSVQPPKVSDANYFKGTDVATKAPFVGYWDFTSVPVWYARNGEYPAFSAGGISTPTPITRHSGSSVQSRIANLLAMGATKLADEVQKQFNDLLAPASGLTSGPIPSGLIGHAFSRSLSTGATAVDVKNLQSFLNSQGYVVAKSGPGSVGNETNKFGGLTRGALAKYQKAHNISPAVGFFGPITRAYVNKLLVK